jgi:hypothetical protein
MFLRETAIKSKDLTLIKNEERMNAKTGHRISTSLSKLPRLPGRPAVAHFTLSPSPGSWSGT